MRVFEIGMFVVGAALVAGPGCKGSSKQEDRAKPAASAAGSAVAGSAAGSAAAGSAAAKGAAVAPAAGGKLGPIDLAAAKLDFAALFPGATVALHPAEDLSGGGSVPDGYASDTIVVEKNGETAVEVTLGAGDKIATIAVFDPAIATPQGLHKGSTVAELAKAVPDATCAGSRLGVTCSGDSAPFVFSLTEDATLPDGDFDKVFPIAQVTGNSAVDYYEWSAPAGKEPLAVRPPIAAGGGDGEDLDRAPTADEIDRCARTLTVTAACGVHHDPEFGWVGGKKQKVTAAAARKACTVDKLATEDGYALPVTLLDAGELGKLEAAAKQGCAQVKAALDEVSPGMGPAGYDPSK